MTVMNKAAPQTAGDSARTETPQEIHSESERRGLIQAMSAEQEAAESDVQRLEVLHKYKQRLGMQRQLKKSEDMIGSLISSQGDKVQDAQIDLNKSMGRLAQKSLQLLVINTSTAEMQGAQQNALQEQQKTLQHQADKLKDQTRKLLEQQKILTQRQESIEAANQGLMAAHRITKEQAQQLVGCANQVTEAEQKFAVANQQLRTALEKNVHDTVTQCLDQLNAGFSSMDLRRLSFEEQVANTLSAQSKRTRERLTLFTSASADFQIDMEQKLHHHVQSMVEQAAAQHALLLQREEASTAQLETFQQDVQQDLTTALEHKTLALQETLHGAQLALDAALQEQDKHLQAQRISHESSVQRVGTDLLALQAALQEQEKHLQVQRTSHESSVQRLGSDLLALEAALQEQDKHLQAQRASHESSVQRLGSDLSALEACVQKENMHLQAQRASYESSVQRLTIDINGNVDAVKTVAVGVSKNTAAASALQHQIDGLRAQQRVEQLMHRRALAVVASIASVSLGWQIARYFALF